MDNLTTAEAKRDLYAITVFYQTLYGLNLYLEIVIVDFGTYLDFTKLLRLAFDSVVAFGLGLHIFILSIVHQAAYRRLGGGIDFHQVKVSRLSMIKRFTYRHPAQLASFFIDNQDLGHADLIVNSQFLRNWLTSVASRKTKIYEPTSARGTAAQSR